MISNFTGEYAFLSNFYPSLIIYNGMMIDTVEHLYQSLKTKVNYQRNNILNASTPGKAKRLGSICDLREDWDRHKIKFMLLCLKLKFHNPEMKKLLLSTGDSLLIEGNMWHDNFWGNCFCSKCANINGKNVLGKLLMKLRKE